ncbi:ABC transporter permease [Isachenkonia alkalipeptolytica]|uniref:ABC transporter permease n=1 Tax=Isachenkonia alkalipeptolytica TaxID=2565777 RepID=A0AA43XJ62_9CLOT|nr:ABC transporter permease [Isachenkonia alkalipeptolytica]NBG87204.1 ABC transporter permease [Isachenkonia alkalipeptolytica]
MITFILKRIGYGILTLFIVISITFILIRLIPGNPIERMTEELPEQTRLQVQEQYGFNEPLRVQYKNFWRDLIFEQDLGESLTYRGRKVSDTIANYAPISGRLGAQALLFGVSFGVLFGLFAAFFRGKVPDYGVMFLSILGISVPSFVFAALLQYFLAIQWGLLPITGWGTLQHTFLPSLALAMGPLAKYARYMRANCLDVLNQDYILTAQAKGASQFRIIRKHIFRNSILPIVTLLGPQVAMIFSGSFVIERIFSIPGLGSYFVSSVTDRDYTMIMGQTIFIASLYIMSLVVVDILYALIDPRIKISGS